MRLLDKLLKAATPRAFTSARRRTARTFRPRRFVARLTPELLQREIEQTEFPALAARYREANPGKTSRKYVDLAHWLKVNLRRVRELELDFGPRRRVLDLGMGVGYFLWICRWLGHDVLGLDIDELPMFTDLSRALGVPRKVWRIAPFTPLPDLGARFDVVTAYMICFNNHHRPDVWGPEEWSFFLDDVASRMKTGGKLWLELNPEGYGYFTPELRAFFLERGATIDHHRVVFTPWPRALA